MEISVSCQEGYVLAATTGRIDDDADGPFREHLLSLLAQPGTNVVLDLAQSKLISSRGIGHLVSLVAHANTNSSRIILANVSPFMSVVFTRCKLDNFFETADNVDAAVRRIQGHTE